MTPEKTACLKQYIIRILRLMLGLFLYGTGVAVSIRANIGYAPWEVFHAGLSGVFGISFGIASIVTGAVICVLVVVLGEKLGLGTILNMLMVGLFVDLNLNMNIIPYGGWPGITGTLAGVALLATGLLILSVGSFFYISSGFGAGPRDSLMVALKRKTKLPVGVCRSAIEFAALSVGWLLGGMVGLGTLIAMLAVGAFIQTTFKVFRFKPETVEHETFTATYNKLRGISGEK